MGFFDGFGLSTVLDIGGKLLDRADARKASKTEFNRQKEFAQTGIQWKVADAKKAGIHPLYALGANTLSYSPQAVGDSGTFSSIGQNLSRAAYAGMNKEQRNHDTMLREQQLERNELENEFLRAQIASEEARLKQLGQPPAPSITTPHTRTASPQGNRNMEYGTIPDLGFINTGTGIANVPSKDVKERLEDNFVLESRWNWNHIAKPLITGKPPQKPPKAIWKKEFPKASDVRWNPKKQEWQPIYGGGISPNDFKGKKSGWELFKGHRDKYQKWMDEGGFNSGKLPPVFYR